MTASPFDLTGKVALVTGGAGHLGSAFSEALSFYGAKVIIASRDVERCQKLASKFGPQHEGVALDLDDADAIRRVIRDIVARHGALDVLVNNGYAGPTPSIDEMKVDDFELTFRRGVTSYFVASQEASFHMRKKSGGSIVNVASMYGLVGSYPEVYEGLSFISPANYHALKGSVLQLTRHLAVYWARYGIRVNAISPGAFPPSRITEAPEGKEFHRRLCEKIPLKRTGEPGDVGGALLLLASGAGSYITGQNIVVDGGWTAW